MLSLAPPKKVRCPLRGKYLIQNCWANWLLALVDFFLSIFIKPKAVSIPLSPKKILLSSSSHFGDVVQMTSILPFLKRHFPDSQIGVLVGSWSLPIVMNHPDIDFVHTLDHWKLNRSSQPLFKKIFRYFRTKKRAIQSIQKTKYDIAIDTYYYFPNAIPIFWKAKIPVRIGYTSGGFGPYLTHSKDWENYNQSVVKFYEPLLRFITNDGVKIEKLRPHLPRLARTGHDYFRKHYSDSFGNYVVVHIGAGSPLKEWPVTKWKELVDKLEGLLLVFTGKGNEEKEKIAHIIRGRKGCLNLANRLSWEEFMGVIQDASLLISVDSVPGHLAAAFEIPSVLLYTGMANVHHWAPVNPNATILTHKVPCSPCFRSKGCSEMSCLREISVEDVHRACQKCLQLPISKKNLSTNTGNFFSFSD